MNTEDKVIEKIRGRFFVVSSIIGTSPRIQEVIRLVEKIADSPLNVLITGESGTGKELIARTIHYHSSRFGKPFMDINCAALPESLLESELFGIEKGVATGVERRVGKIEMANGGTLFLDEIGDMSISAQAALLRVLQERKLEKVGGRSTINVDVRVLAATNKHLQGEIKKGSFREDLYYRLNVVHVHMPPLREMREDIPLLAQYFLSSFSSELGRYMGFSPHAMDCLVNYEWPGNVRELENEVKRVAIIADSDVIDESYLSENIKKGVAQNLGEVRSFDSLTIRQAHGSLPRTQSGLAKTTHTLKEAVEEFEIRFIKEVLEENGGNKQRTSEILGLTRQGLGKKLRKYERTLTSRSADIDKEPGNQGDKDTQHIRPTKVFRPFDSLRRGSGQASTKLKAHSSRQAERRHLTVMFCDLIGFTSLSEHVDPEDLREVIRAYLDVCSKVAGRFGGRIAKYFGDGMLVYFGYPLAHEDNAKRAVKAGLEIVRSAEAICSSTDLTTVEPPLQSNTRIRLPLQVRVGIHTGLVVIGEMGIESMTESIAIVGEAPNIAVQLLNLAEPNTVVISSDTYQLVEGLFDCHYLGQHTLKGFSTPLGVYRMLHESSARSRFEVAKTKGLTPLVGREQEVGLLLERWERVKGGKGQVILVNGEPGIGKSRLVQILNERLAGETHVRIESHCSPYYQNSALYPVINHLQRLLQLRKEDSPEEKLDKLERALERYGFSLQNTVPLFASLLSLPLSKNYSPPNLTPQRQKQKLLETLHDWMLKDAEKQPVLFIVEDLHWLDPSTLEFLNLVVDKISKSRILALFTFRPDFNPPWTIDSHLTGITLGRLARRQVETMIEKVTGGKALPAEVINQVIAKSDGIPLFIEELTKMVIESSLLKEEDGSYTLTGPLTQLAIPTTLQDSLMARLDRLATGKEIAQLGATLGREFTYDLLKAVSSLDEAALQRDLSQLVEAELLYQRDFPSQPKYIFKHALIQEAAYRSLLRSKRQEYHQKIAQVLEERFPETRETQPELLAHHYTEARLITQAIPYWQRAGQRAIERSANVEAIGHLTKGLELLKTLPDTPERTQQELDLQIALGPALMATKGWAAPEVEQAYARARELCHQLGETPQLFLVLWGLAQFYIVRAEFQTTRELAEQYLRLAQLQDESALIMAAHFLLGATLFHLGEYAPAREHLGQGIALYDPQQHCSHTFLYGPDLGVFCLSYASHALWHLGYPDRALQRSHEAMALAEELSHPFSLALALDYAAMLCEFHREHHAAQERAEAAILLCTEQGFAYYLAWATIILSWTQAEQGEEEGITQIREGLAALRATGAGLRQPYYLAMLAEASGKAGQVEEGLKLLAEALAVMDKTGEYWREAEIYRLKGELLLTLSAENQAEADACFRQAIDIAHRQSAQSLELRAVMSLSHFLHKQGKKEEARQMLAEIYGWFTEGFETKDLKEAKALLEELY